MTRASWAIVIAIVAILAAGASLYILSGSQATDPDTLCRINAPPSEVVAVLLDASDEMATLQRIQVMNHLRRVRDQIERFGLIDVYSVGTEPHEAARSIFRICNPGDGSDLNRLYQNPELARRRWQSYAARLQAQLDTLASSSGTPHSPLFEAVQEVAVTTLADPAFDGLPKRLVFVSDLRQNVPAFDMYGQIVPFTDISSSAYFERVRADLTDVSVSIYYLSRAAPPRETAELVAFWDAYFAAQGGSLDLVERVFGE